MTLAAREGANPESCFLPEHIYKKVYDEVKKYLTRYCAEGTYPSNFTIHTSLGKIQIYPEATCHGYIGYLCQMDTWRYDSNFGYYCTAPGYNVILRF